MKSRMLIGIITTECHTEYQSEIMRGLISQAFKSSCDIAVICPLNNFLIETTHKFNEKSIFKLILSDVFSGFIYDRNSFYNAETQKYIDKLCTQSGKPIMLIDYNDHKRFETTMADDIDAIEMMTDHLIEVHGCRKIYCLTGTKGILCSDERLKGYLRSMKKHGLPIEKSYYEYGDFWYHSGAEFAQSIISGKLEKPDAIVCANDIMAASLAENLISGGIRVPEDIAVTGFDATIDSYHGNPSITSCKRQNFQMGAEAFRRLYRIITGRICSKVPDEPCEIRLGTSCGCMENPELKREIKRKLRTTERLQNKFFCSDMLVDITNTSDIASLIDRIDHYSYLIYRMNQMFICVTEKYEKVSETAGGIKLDFDISEPVDIVYDKSAVCRNAAHGKCSSSGEAVNFFRSSRKQPSAFYISPLHYNDNFFGFAAVSFGKFPVAYNHIYLQWISNVNMALEKVRMHSMMNVSLKKADSVTVCDELTGLMNKNSFKAAFLKKTADPPPGCRNIEYLHIELTDLKSFYCKNGHSKTAHALKAFADAVRRCASSDDICGTIAPGCYGIVSFSRNDSKNIFSTLKASLQNIPAFSGDDPITFTIGSASALISDNTDFWELVYQASINNIYSYSQKESNLNPQFEKLCELRNKMMKNPEHAWNISEIADTMFISKSYLQKIYKSYFNKSIIEELIQFRLKKAKELLAETDRTVTEIASDCGYSTYNYFVRQFRAAENVSPTEYREIHKSEAL
ncbi:MAG: substrate-binding domain-containing protein [Ruminococcus sp.]|nr:substrate-binding domain-containing protein [Ruminococcus sp.]